MTTGLSLKTRVTVNGREADLCTDRLDGSTYKDLPTWETMLCYEPEGEWDQFYRRYYSEEEAIAGHELLTYQTVKGTFPAEGPYRFEED